MTYLVKPHQTLPPSPHLILGAVVEVKDEANEAKAQNTLGGGPCDGVGEVRVVIIARQQVALVWEGEGFGMRGGG